MENNFQNSVSATYVKSVPFGRFTVGKVICCSKWRKIAYWIGDDEIRVTKTNAYFLVAGSETIKGTTSFVHHVYKLDNCLFPPNIEDVEEVYVAGESFKGSKVEIYF